MASLSFLYGNIPYVILHTFIDIFTGLRGSPNLFYSFFFPVDSFFKNGSQKTIITKIMPWRQLFTLFFPIPYSNLIIASHPSLPLYFSAFPPILPLLSASRSIYHNFNFVFSVALYLYKFSPYSKTLHVYYFSTSSEDLIPFYHRITVTSSEASLAISDYTLPNLFFTSLFLS